MIAAIIITIILIIYLRYRMLKAEVKNDKQLTDRHFYNQPIKNDFINHKKLNK